MLGGALMRVALGSVEVTPRERRALTLHMSGGRDARPAGRDALREYLRQNGERGLSDLAWSPLYTERLNATRDGDPS
jgi:hypothetical protein